MIILGISAFYHDSAACLLQDGKIIAAIQEERFSRNKHDQNFPHHAIDACLRLAELTIQDVDYVSFYERSDLKFDRLLKTYLSYVPKGISTFSEALPVWLIQKLWLSSYIKNELGFTKDIVFPEHHETHASSAFYPSPFNEAAFLTMDGVGEWTTTSFGWGKGNDLKIQEEIHFPHSLGLLYSAFTYYTGFKVNSGEYKLMGLAPYGEAKYVQVIYDNLIDVKKDGSFRLNLDYFDYCVGRTMTNEKFHTLFGRPPRASETEISQHDMDLARSIQVVTEEVVLKMVKHIQKTTGMKKLCLAGGVALNCVANEKIVKSGLFEDIWIQPAAGDAGGALGAAFYVWHKFLGNKRKANGKTDIQQGSYLGTEYSDIEIESFLRAKKAPYRKFSQAELLKTTARLLSQEKVVGWFQGRMEYGPRALGSRSIIGDARSTKMQSIMNLKIKFRESFRPFAPSILFEHMSEWFDLVNSKGKPIFSPYMLLTAPIKQNKRLKVPSGSENLFGIDKLKIIRSRIPAVTHVDYSARLQTVHVETNPLYHALLTTFYKLTGCPVIINTSFNVRGEPIVESPEDAYRCFMRTEMDYLVVGSYVLDKKRQPPYIEKTDWRKELQLD